MNDVRRIFSRRLIASGFALALSGFALLSTPAKAANGCNGPGTVTVYYNRNGQEVGRYTQACNSTVCEGSGAITSNFEILYLSCPPPGGGA